MNWYYNCDISNDKNLTFGSNASMWMKQLDWNAGQQEVGRCHVRGKSDEYIASKWRSIQARNLLRLLNSEETSSIVQIRGISCPAKKDLCSSKILKKPPLQRKHEVRLTSRSFINLLMIPNSFSTWASTEPMCTRAPSKHTTKESCIFFMTSAQKKSWTKW